MSAPAFDVAAALVQQRHLLEQKAVHIRALLNAVDAALASIKKGTPVIEEQMFDAFEAEAEAEVGRHRGVARVEAPHRDLRQEGSGRR